MTMKYCSLFVLLLAMTVKVNTKDAVPKQQNVEIYETQKTSQTNQHALHFPNSEEDHFQLPSALRPSAIPLSAQTQSTVNRLAATASLSAEEANGDRISQYAYIRDFSWLLFQGSKVPSAIGNLVISPLQPQFLLSLLRTTASGNTEEEIGRTIGEVNARLISDLVTEIQHERTSLVELGVANAVFAADNFKLNNSFIREAHSRGVDIIPVNFNSADESTFVINNWISNATKNQITSLYRPDPMRGTRLLLANTIYFRSQWRYAFNGSVPEKFETTEKLIKTVPTMKITATLRAGAIQTRSGLGAQFVELPYVDNDYSMILILPQLRHRLDTLIRGMQASDFNDIMEQMNHSFKKTVHLSMPKFTVQTRFSLVNVLLKLGIVDLFTSAAKLPFFSSDRSVEPLRVDDILQQSLLQVDEKGTVATSATISHVITLSLSSVPEEIHFTVDQPFLAVIFDRRNQIPLFIAKIFDP